MDTTRLTGTIVPAQVLLSGREVRDILSGVGEVREGRSEGNMELAYQALQKYYLIICLLKPRQLNVQISNIE